MERMDDVFVQNSTSAVRQFQLSDLISVGGAEQSWPQLLVVMVVVWWCGGVVVVGGSHDIMSLGLTQA